MSRHPSPEPDAAATSDDVPQRFDSLEQAAFLNLWRTYDRLRLHEDALFAQHDLTPQQYNILRLLRAAQPGKLPTLTLASKLISRAPDITRMLDKLEKRNFIVRSRLPDNRRIVEVGITAAGSKLLSRLDPQVRECHRLQLGHLSEDELHALIRLLHAAREPHEKPDSFWATSPSES